MNDTTINTTVDFTQPFNFAQHLFELTARGAARRLISTTTAASATPSWRNRPAAWRKAWLRPAFIARNACCWSCTICANG